MKKLTITDIKASDSRLLPILLGDAAIASWWILHLQAGRDR